MDPESLQSELHNLLIPEAGIYFRHDDEWDILSQHIRLPVFSLWVNDIFSKKDIVLRPFTPVPIYALHFMFEDSLQAQLRQDPGYLLEESECNLFNLPPGLHKIPMPNSKKILSLHINIDPAAIPALIQQEPILQFLEGSKNARIGGPVNVYPYQVNRTCDFLIQQILTCDYTGENARKFLYRCCLNLLLNIAQQQHANSQRLLYSTVMHGAIYHQLFQYLETHLHKQHSNTELAYIFDIPAEQLAYGFQQLFATTVEDFTHMVKMMFIYNRIQAKALPHTLIAEITGYSSVLGMMRCVEDYYLL
ncbi:hypothetical protein SAMN05518672_1011038 [Chitinophaga sp. CF118]|nr:hypothetical protein SAMN05518672_1011038 [Chitinophaga sp. CF118]